MKNLTRVETKTLAAKMLKAAFPSVNFSISISGGGLSIAWTGGPSSDTMRDLTAAFSTREFDGMTDMAGYVGTYYTKNGDKMADFGRVSLNREAGQDCYDIIRKKYEAEGRWASARDLDCDACSTDVVAISESYEDPGFMLVRAGQTFAEALAEREREELEIAIPADVAQSFQDVFDEFASAEAEQLNVDEEDPSREELEAFVTGLFADASWKYVRAADGTLMDMTTANIMGKKITAKNGCFHDEDGEWLGLFGICTGFTLDQFNQTEGPFVAHCREILRSQKQAERIAEACPAPTPARKQIRL